MQHEGKEVFRLLFIILIIPIVATACPDEMPNAEVEIIRGAVKAGGNHQNMDRIEISYPVKYLEMHMGGIELTYGEVSEYFIPLEYKIEDEKAKVDVVGYADSMKGFEVFAVYDDGSCRTGSRYVVGA